MADTFFNNQVVTAEDLNNIAIDLGYADYSHFPEEPPESAVSALNRITADLTGKGLLMTGNCMKVSMADDIITIQDGICVFENGAKKRINVDEVVSIPYIEGGMNYVYLLNNTAANKIELINSLEAPVDGDFVMLALVDENKKVHNRRVFSTSKVGIGLPQTEETKFTEVDLEYPESDKAYIIGQIPDVDLTKYNYAIMYYNGGGDRSRSGGCFGLFDLNKGVFTVRIIHGGSTHYYETNTVPWYVRSYNSYEEVRIVDGVLSCITDKEYFTFPGVIVRFV